MSNIVTIGFVTEGATDVRFLENIIKRTFEEIAFDCSGEIEVYDPVNLGSAKGPFIEAVVSKAKEAYKKGLMVLCVHADADASTDQNTFTNKIDPAFQRIAGSDEALCRNLAAIVPVRMTEAWMLADKETLKKEIGADVPIRDLGLNRPPERVSDPKSAISDAIRMAYSNTPRRRPRISIADLYLPLGQKARMEELERLSSYRKFRSAVREVYRSLNYLH